MTVCALTVTAVAACSATDPQPRETVEATKDWTTTADQWMVLYRDMLEFRAQGSGIADPPDVEIVRIVPIEEWPEAQVDCLAEEGFSASVYSGGAVEYADVPKEQGPALNLAVYVCEAKYPYDVRRNEPLPEKQATAQFEFFKSTVAPCVTALGYDVSEPPSLQTWLSDYSATGNAWDPIAEAWEASGRNHEVLMEIQAECPREAPGLYPEIDGLQY
ncbi:hypothetical protein [Microbacterium sp. Leaf288]|uniref:hypothetical protein n=1 Tax=Microbacterium sp. Leaf288 TaxID=1736323 RepID=UPI0012FA5A1E|nr:hypothetical protein [Microbacterium sp. Leaf288]